MIQLNLTSKSKFYCQEIISFHSRWQTFNLLKRVLWSKEISPAVVMLINEEIDSPVGSNEFQILNFLIDFLCTRLPFYFTKISLPLTFEPLPITTQSHYLSFHMRKELWFTIKHRPLTAMQD